MKKLLIFNILCTALIFSCSYFSNEGTVRTRATAMTKRNAGLESLGGTYTVAIITDVHFGKGSDRSIDRAFMAWLEECDAMSKLPQFIICLGDVAEHGYRDEFEAYNQFCKKIEAQFPTIKIFNTLGNHDLYNKGWKHWKELIAPYTPLYYFKTSSFSWYFLDTADGTVGVPQYDVVSRAYAEDDSPKIVCVHNPLHADASLASYMHDSTTRNLLISLFARSNVLAVLEGHTHNYAQNDFGFIEYNVPGYLEKRTWALATVDEANASIQFELVSQ